MSCSSKCSVCEQLQGIAVKVVGDGEGEALSLEVMSELSALPLTEIQAHYPTTEACLYDAYDNASGDLVRIVTAAFEDDVDWWTAFEAAMQDLFARMAGNPSEARFCFVEAPRLGRQLQRRCEDRRREIVDLLAGEYERRRNRERLSDVRIELLVGASFHAVSDALAAGGPDELLAVGPRLSELAGVVELAVAA
jgi:hypothetical protein